MVMVMVVVVVMVMMVAVVVVDHWGQDTPRAIAVTTDHLGVCVCMCVKMTHIQAFPIQWSPSIVDTLGAW